MRTADPFERALEIQLWWGDTALRTLSVREQPQVMLGDGLEVTGLGPFQRAVVCDLEAPSLGLPERRFPLAVCLGEGCRYVLNLHRSFEVQVERAGGLLTLDQLVASRAAEAGALPETFEYRIAPGETVWIVHGQLVVALRYVPRASLRVPPLLDRVNLGWLNVFVLSLFFHALLIVALLGSPSGRADFGDALRRSSGRIVSTIFKPAEERPRGDLLAKLRDTGAAKGKEGRPKKRRDDDGARALGTFLDGIAAVTAQRTRGGDELERALENLTGRRTTGGGDLDGVGSRGPGPGGGGDLKSISIGDFGPAGTRRGDDESFSPGRMEKSRDREIIVVPGPIRLTGGIDKALIRAVIDQHREQVRYCYEEVLARSPGLFGKVHLEWTIDKDGIVRQVRIEESTIGAEVPACLAARIKSWRFPQPIGGGIVVVRYPFLFRNSG